MKLRKTIDIDFKVSVPSECFRITKKWRRAFAVSVICDRDVNGPGMAVAFEEMTGKCFIIVLVF